MKAIRNRFAPDTFSVTDTDGKLYTVQGNGISLHRYKNGRVLRVPVDPVASAALAERIMAAVVLAPDLTPRKGIPA